VLAIIAAKLLGGISNELGSNPGLLAEGAKSNCMHILDLQDALGHTGWSPFY
jgi:hypothetical protein